jgi:hypothetical protein
MIKRINAKVNIGDEHRSFEAKDMDKIISEVDSYLVSKK